MRTNLIVMLLLLMSLSSAGQLSTTSLRFDGNDDCVYIPAHPSYDVQAGDFTIEAWIRDEMLTTSYSREEIFSNLAPVNSYGIDLSLIWGSLALSLNGHTYGFPNGDLRDSSCHHIAISRSNGMILSYLDGQSGVGWYAPDSVNMGADLRIGGAGTYIGGPSGNSFKGLIKEVRFWNTARTNLEILNNMYSTTPAGPGLIGYWRCNEGSGTTVYDYSSNMNNGSVGQFGFPASTPVFAAGCTSCIPAPHIAASGPVAFCSGGGVQLFTYGAAGYIYQWRLNGNPVAVHNPFYDVAASGSYSLEAINSCGSAISNAIQVTANPLPSASITASGPLSFCPGGNVLLSTSGGLGKTFQWRKNGVNIPGATLVNYTAAASGTYKVIVTNIATGCTKLSGTGKTVALYGTPPATITPQGPTSFCAGDSVQLKANSNAQYSYQWKKNNTTIAGATSGKYNAKTAGTYKVKVTSANGCTNLSAGVSVTVPCREEQDGMEIRNDLQAAVYPNPAPGEMNILLSDAFSGECRITVTDSRGQIISRMTTREKQLKLDNSKLAPGVYFLEISSADGTTLHKRFAVQR